MTESKNMTIALLIDAENISAKYMEALDKELVVLGRVTYKRMYGDFTKSEAQAWRELANRFSISPIQQYTYTKGKNATDSRLIIDAMDILYSNTVNAVCIMSSDSDFTGLAKRLKESNIFIIGAGEEKTPDSFINVCDRFFNLENLVGKAAEKEPAAAKPKKKAEKTVKRVRKEEILDFVEKLLENGSLDLGFVSSKIYQAYPQFDYGDYGVKKSYDFYPADRFHINKGDKRNIDISLK